MFSTIKGITTYNAGYLPEVTVTAKRIPTTQDSLDLLARIFIKHEESYNPYSKWDHKQDSNGWSTRAKYPGEVIDIYEANDRFNRHYEKVVRRVNENFPNLEGGQWVATVSFVYNLSIYQVLDANVTSKRLRQGKKPPFHLWVHASGQVEKGLVKRRERESQIWDDWRKVYNEELEEMKSNLKLKIQKHHAINSNDILALL